MGRLEVGLNYAKHLGATHAILTGKADPSQENNEYLCDLIKTARRYLPLVDFHTNGFLLGRKPEILPMLVQAGLTMITFSIASFDQEINASLMRIRQETDQLIKLARKHRLLVRCSLVMNRLGVRDFDGVIDYIRQAGELGAHMVVVREVWVPEVYGEYNHTVYEWNRQNQILIKPIQEQFRQIAKDPVNPFGLHERDPLPWGTPVFVMDGFTKKSHGVNITFACCDEATSGPVIKSIVHRDDHGFRNWDHAGDVLY
jgi:hypothetical protein